MATWDQNQTSSQKTIQAVASFKAFLMKNSTKSNQNLYDHLFRVLMKVMDERPHNVVDVFEDMSLDVKLGLYEDKQSTLRDSPQTEDAELLADQQCLLFSQESYFQYEQVDTRIPNVNEIGFYMEQAGVGLGRDEMQRVFLALKQLAQTQYLPSCRLWGKILGTESSYIVAEAEYREGEEDVEESTEEAAEDKEEDAETQDNEENEMHPLCEWIYNPPPEVPKEPMGTGANRCVYYVCNEPGLPWVKLPTVSPAQITVARQIRKFFTGRLDAPVLSYPPFPGKEANYLRAQIARISAGTQVSPQGFYQLIDEESDEEEDVDLDRYEINPEFTGIPVTEMVASLSNWVHRAQHILKQGRCTWVNLSVKSELELDEEEEDEETEEESEELQQEVGPRFLTPLSEDAEIFNMPPWTSKLSSMFASHHTIAVLRSNLWPGAYAYACGEKFENIYVGWGLKYLREAYNPRVPPIPEKEYPSGPEITETLDPTLEEEQALQEALEEQLTADEEDMLLSDEEEENDDDYDDD